MDRSQSKLRGIATVLCPAGFGIAALARLFDLGPTVKLVGAGLLLIGALLWLIAWWVGRRSERHVDP